MTPALRNRLLAIGALLAACGGLAAVAFGNLGENLVYYWSPSELLSNGERAYGPTIRLGGVVRPGSIQWDAAQTQLSFEVADDHKPDARYVPVLASETPPQMFREGIGVVVEGTWDKAHRFTSSRLMVNHSNEYRAPKEGEEPKQWQDTVAEPSASARTP
jgi:cytochrome c-type biogenesis protein CcmE